jgi:hypothetical protein
VAVFEMRRATAEEAQGSKSEVGSLLDVIQQVGPKGQGNPQASAAWKQLSAASPESLPEMFGALDEANSLAANWIRAAIDTIAERTLQAGESLPTEQIEAYLRDTRHDPRARRLAFEWLVQADPSAQKRIVPDLLNDPSVELRRDTVAQLIEQADPLLEADKKDAAKDIYQRAMVAARDSDQVKYLTQKLKELGVEVDLPTHFGFITTWKLIGPFGNEESKGFDVAYPPETEIDFTGSYPGKSAPVKWFDHTTDDDYGLVSFIKAMEKMNDVTGYAAAEFQSPESRPVQLRLGCVNANKVWLNGKLLISNDVYHSGSSMDQYVAEGQLKAGRNVILVKVLQNNQPQDWAQRWEFQLRVCDRSGTAVLSSDRTSR